MAQGQAQHAPHVAEGHEAAILTLDGVGEWSTAAYGVGVGNRLRLTHHLQFPHSLGLLYSAFTYYCGFKVNVRQFGGLWLVFFLGLAAWQSLAHGPSTTSALAAAVALLGAVGLARPRVVRPVFVGWMMLAFPVSWLVSHVALAIVFYGFFTPLTLVFRLSGRDPLALKRRNTESFRPGRRRRMFAAPSGPFWPCCC